MIGVIVAVIQGDESVEKGLLMCPCIFVANFMTSILQQHAWHACARSSRQTWAALTSLIFEKPAFLNSDDRSDITEGELVSMMSTDAAQVLNLMQFFAIFASCPVYIIGTSIFLYLIL